jgi:hypothetical protein
MAQKQMAPITTIIKTPINTEIIKIPFAVHGHYQIVAQQSVARKRPQRGWIFNAIGPLLSLLARLAAPVGFYQGDRTAATVRFICTPMNLALIPVIASARNLLSSASVHSRAENRRSSFICHSASRPIAAAQGFLEGGRPSRVPGLESLATSRPMPRGLRLLPSGLPR